MYRFNYTYIVYILCITILAACEKTIDPHDAETDQESSFLAQKTGPHLSSSSRVFDGRDSLNTGIIGPTATKANYDIVTQYLAIKVDGGDDVGSGLGEISDPDNLDPSTLLFESRKGNPILTPGGKHVTWGQFRRAKGAIIVKCTKKGTRITVHLADLIPNGVYTIRNDFFDTYSDDLLGQIGFTGSKAPSAPKSSFRASASGEGHISGLVRPGALGMDLISDCMIEDATNDGIYEWDTVAIYQMDGTPGLDAEGTFVEQGSFAFFVWQGE